MKVLGSRARLWRSARGRVVGSSGCVLDSAAALGKPGLDSGDVLICAGLRGLGGGHAAAFGFVAPMILFLLQSSVVSQRVLTTPPKTEPPFFPALAEQRGF